MDWTSGYASDLVYTAGFYREQSPVYLNYGCILNGIEPVDLDREFTYFELGFGRGVTSNLLAASHPNGRFYAADFNPAHVAGARQIAAAAELDNLRLLENSFEELAKGAVADLPQFDFITLHGIYTWVTAENRQYIVDFLTRYLKPGGIVYLSYNAMPGWASSLPLQRLIVDHAELNPARSDVQMDNASDFIAKLSSLNPAYLANNLSAESRVKKLKTAKKNYLVHEYMHKHWQPMYHADVARDLANAKLEYVGSAELHNVYRGLYLNPDRMAFLNSISDPTMRETVVDYMTNTAFRKDIFVRGARRINSARQAELLNTAGIALSIPAKDLATKVSLVNCEFTGSSQIYDPVFEAIKDGPKTIRELSELPSMRGKKISTIAEIVTLLVASNQVSIFFESRKSLDKAAAKRMNAVIAKQVQYGDEFHAYCSTLTGCGVSASYQENLLLWAMLNHPGIEDAEKLARFAVRILYAQNLQLLKDGKAIVGDEENALELQAQFAQFIEHKVPVWKSLGLF
ncbi:class I SAM-dependent methyltransferase [Undibacterium fentianense]|uniref:Methyltransferase regulatory domain-containing protein n=1 Tax=Undibacterium fentianense TaxID=2828728 RepID=A0A941E5D3_9BURK|nr:class I SAM-dependent methyltransferase [Undibacterium fentianense]MBR7801457.1 methyltransferase regulatory domain-containing protein [Undibacterium fentianense]